MYLLDTNYVSEVRKRSRANPNVMAWSTAHRRSDSFLSIMTVLEIEKGILRLLRRDPDQSRILRDWLDGAILPEFAGRLLNVDLAIARRAAALHVPDPRPDSDALIAATALVHGLTVVTRNTADFAPMGVPTLDPWAWTQAS